MSSETGEATSMHVDSEDELDWEEVQVPEHQEHLEITLDGAKPENGARVNKKKAISHAERLIRIDCHKIHTIALIANARVRNKWINDPILHARLLSLTPLHLQNAFGVIHKSRVPDQNQRGRMFERAMENLTNWWSHTFFEITPEGHIRNHTYEEIQQELQVRGLHLQNNEGPDQVTLDPETLQDIVDDEAEIIRSPKSLMKHALMQSGSRDTSAQLFTALCRGLGIPARLVVSIQSVPWQAGIDKPKTSNQKLKLKGRETVDFETNQSSDAGSSTVDLPSDNGRRLDAEPVSQMSAKAKGKQKANPVKLRKTKDQGHILRAGTSRPESPDPLTSPPIFWTEVFSRPDSKWFPIDPIRGIVNKRKVFDPTPSANAHMGPRMKIENRMLYVLAFEEDCYARDVTRRYAKQYAAKVSKMQGGSNTPNIGGGGKGRRAWWERVVNVLHRPFRLHRDDLEDQELDAAQVMEGMPTTMSGFKDHPIYVLERHLKQTEILYPPPPVTVELGKFRGEPVYSRSAVVSLKTAENWLRTAGRAIKQGEQPLKKVKVRPGTINKMRELEVIKDELKVAGQDSPDGSSTVVGEVMQGLYAYAQTEAYIPDPVIEGIIPKNNFGNIDLYVPSMLPQGGVHIPFKGVAKIAKKLGFDYAEAVTGFEFRKRRAYPVIEGVVVAAENEATLLEAYWESERDADEKARLKKQERVLKHWIRLIHGLRIRQRLQEQYGSKANNQHEEPDSINKVEEVSHTRDDSDNLAGGFLAGADTVVTAFHLPKTTLTSLQSPRHSPTKVGKPSEPDESIECEMREAPELRTYDLDEDTMDVDVEEEESRTTSEGVNQEFVPKTMQQMAADAAQRERAQEDERKRCVFAESKDNVASVEFGSQSESISTGRVTRSRSGAINSQTTSKPRPGASLQGKRSASRRQKGASANKATKKRKRRNDYESEEDNAETSQDDDAENMDEGDGDGEQDEWNVEDEEDDDDVYSTKDKSSSRSQRTRTGRRSNAISRSTRAKTTSTSAMVMNPSHMQTTSDSTLSSRRTLRSRKS